MTRDQLRKQHYQRLKSDRPSSEYAEYAASIGAEVPQGTPPSLVGNRWRIDEEIDNEFPNVLPPLGWKGGSSHMSEFSFGDIITRYTKEGDEYYCEFARYPSRQQARTSPVETPWGASQSSVELAPGIVRPDTSSHGGYYISPARVATMPKPLREFKPWAGANWYEEGSDWERRGPRIPAVLPAGRRRGSREYPEERQARGLRAVRAFEAAHGAGGHGA